ncbi:MAG: T9SS type A sorting domain-containing protein [Bacteroidia bacterium]|nr:T9SS type A sorting domain-containing protein [Bacteroidia bacterium]
MSRFTQQPAQRSTQSLRNRTAIAILAGAALLTALLMLLLQPAGVTSACGPCTTTISSISTATINPSSGDVICITSSGEFRGVIRRNSSSGSGTVTICNEGKIQNATLEFNKGVNIIHNYGTLEPASFQFNSGTSTNTVTSHAGASSKFASFQLYTSGTKFNNYGSFTAGSFTLSSGAAFVNHAGGTASSSTIEVNSNSSLENAGTWNANGNVRVNSNGSLQNNNTLSITGNIENNGEFDSDGELSAGGNIQMNGSSRTGLSGSVSIAGNVEANKELAQSGLMDIGGNLTVNGSGRITVSGIISVDGNLTNNGQLNGPAVASGNWGRINVSGNSTQNGGGKLQYNLDVCDAGLPPGGLDVNYGSKQSSVTHCVNSPVVNLPVEWGGLSAAPAAAGIELRWNTYKELNNDFFSVERSPDARSFQQVGEVPGAGTSSQPQTYTFTDANPPGGTVYYRIRQTDYDGQHSFSAVVEAAWEAPAFSMYFFPNPVADQGTLRVMADQDGPAVIQVMDQQGRTVARAETGLRAGQNDVEFAADTWAPGLYVVELRRSGGGAPVTLKVIKR